MTCDGSREGRAAAGSGANGGVAAWCASLWIRVQQPDQSTAAQLPDLERELGNAAPWVHKESGHMPAREEVLPTGFWMVVQRLRRLSAEGITNWNQLK